MTARRRKPKATKVVAAAGFRFRRLLLVLVLGAMVVGAGLGAGTVAGVVRAMPPVDSYTISPGNMTTFLYDRHGDPITELFFENRVPVSIDEVPEHTRHAFIAIEDARFYTHYGVDPTGILRAFWHNLTRDGRIQGGSTITQQVARLSFEDIGFEQTIERKLHEAIVAVHLERRYTKNEILGEYLNGHFFGYRAYGLGAASQVYFGKDVAELTIAESALLAALPVAPSRYAPFDNPEGAKARQELVINLMVEHGLITPADGEAARAVPMDEMLVESPDLSQDSHPHPWFVDQVFQDLLDYFTDHFRQEGFSATAAEGQAEAMIFGGGLHVHTTLDPDLQTALNDAIAGVLDPIDPLPAPADAAASPPVQAAGVFMEPDTGYVRALVGGREHTGLRSFIRATQAKRQPGSAFKPVIAYGPALEAGHSPASIVDDNPLVRGDWGPRNVDHRHLGLTTYREAVRRSVNVPAVRVVDAIGVEAALDYARRLGIESLVSEPQTLGLDDRSLAVALGGLTQGVTPLELTRAYATFANEGIRVEPMFITRITTADGSVIFDRSPRREDIISPQEAYLMTDILRSSVSAYPGAFNSSSYTGHRAKAGPVMSVWDIGGKTGTTDDTTDIWFVGSSPVLTGAVWMGYDIIGGERRAVRLGGVSGFGGLWPTMIWNRTMTAAHADLQPVEFRRPDNIVEVTICIMSGLLPEAECGEHLQRRELFIRGSEPRETGEAFVQVDVVPIDTLRLAAFPELEARDPFLRQRPYLLHDDGCQSGNRQTRTFLNRPPVDVETVRTFRDIAYGPDEDEEVDEASLPDWRQFLPADMVQAAPLLTCSAAPELLDPAAGLDQVPNTVGPTEGAAVSHPLYVLRNRMQPQTIYVYAGQELTLQVESRRNDEVRVRLLEHDIGVTLSPWQTRALSVTPAEEGRILIRVDGGQGPGLLAQIHVLPAPDQGGDDGEDENGAAENGEDDDEPDDED